MTELYRIDGVQLVRAKKTALEQENLVQGWVADDLRMLGIDALLLGKEVKTGHGGRIDVLAMDSDGGLIIIELKRDRTPRELVAQVLDYASWVRRLENADIYDIAQKYGGRTIEEAFLKRFGRALPDTLNASHQMIVVASEFDEATKRIIEYLSEEYDVGINAVFFDVFEDAGARYLATDTLLDQETVADRAVKRSRGPWTGFYYVTGGTEESRPWEDLRQYGFFTASGGKWYTDALTRLKPNDKIFYYQVNNGYLGYGVVTSHRQLAVEFQLDDGRKLIDALPGREYLEKHSDDAEKAPYVVGVDWITTFDRTQGKSFPGIFANQNPVCKLYKQDTADFLQEQFGVENE